MATTSRAEQARQTRSTIIAAAERLIAERGYDATSLQDIADEVGITKAAVYYYFKTKDDLLHSGFEKNYETLAAIFARAEQIRGRTERIASVTSGVVDLALDNRRLINIANNDPAVRRSKLFKDREHDLLRHGVHVLFGDSPTLVQQAAYRFLGAIPNVIATMPDLTDDELREVLNILGNRILTVRG